MTNFELIQDLIRRIQDVENDLRYLRDTAEPLTIDAIDKSLLNIKELGQSLCDIDMALEKEKTGYILF